MAKPKFISKRNGTVVKYYRSKITRAIMLAGIDSKEANLLSKELEDSLEASKVYSVEEIQDLVEKLLMSKGYEDKAKDYILYRYKRSQLRDIESKAMDIIKDTDESIKGDNSNKNTRRAPVTREYFAGILNKKLSEDLLLPEYIIKAHKKGAIHFHDMDYFASRIPNCCLVNLFDMLWNGTVINSIKITRPHSFKNACNIACQIVALVASQQYGGQTFSLAHLAPFVNISRISIRNRLLTDIPSLGSNPDLLEELVKSEVMKEIKGGIQTIAYQILTSQTSNGQTPFTSLAMDINEPFRESCSFRDYFTEDEKLSIQKDLAILIEEVLNQRLEGLPDINGNASTPAFPKLLYFTDENNIKEGEPYWYLTKLAAKCSAKRLNPDYMSAKVMMRLKGDVYPTMGCRSALTPDPINHRYYGRNNQGVVTINLPYVALESKVNGEDFYTTLNHYLDICHRALQLRHLRLKGTKAQYSETLYCYGALARKDPDDVIDSTLFDNNSTISLGYVGLYETCMALFGYSHYDSEHPEVHDYALGLIKYLKDTCDKWRADEGISYSLYGTPEESTTERFAKALKEFPPLYRVNDHDFVTNSYHVFVGDIIDPFDKLLIESKFQELTPGGAISYVECGDIKDNPEALLPLIQYMYEHIMYAEFNKISSNCFVCGSEDTIQMTPDGETKTVHYKCTNCGNTDRSKMIYACRVCGYISTSEFNYGRSQDIANRYKHIGGDDKILDEV